MRYPIFTIYPTQSHEQIECTATSSDVDENVEVYIEVPKVLNNDWDFAHLTVLLPSEKLLECYGFSEPEKNKWLVHIHHLKDEIIEYVKERSAEYGLD